MYFSPPPPILPPPSSPVGGGGAIGDREIDYSTNLMCIIYQYLGINVILPIQILHGLSGQIRSAREWYHQKRFIYRLLTRHGCLPVWLVAA